MILFSINSYSRHKDLKILARILKNHFKENAIIQSVSTWDGHQQALETKDLDESFFIPNSGHHQGTIDSYNFLRKYLQNTQNRFEWVVSLHSDCLPSKVEIFEFLMKKYSDKDVLVTTGENENFGCFNDLKNFGYYLDCFFFKPKVFQTIDEIKFSFGGWAEISIANSFKGFDIVNFSSKRILSPRILSNIENDETMNFYCDHDLSTKFSTLEKVNNNLYQSVKDLIDG